MLSSLMSSPVTPGPNGFCDKCILVRVGALSFGSVLLSRSFSPALEATKSSLYSSGTDSTSTIIDTRVCPCCRGGSTSTRNQALRWMYFGVASLQPRGAPIFATAMLRIDANVPCHLVTPYIVAKGRAPVHVANLLLLTTKPLVIMRAAITAFLLFLHSPTAWRFRLLPGRHLRWGAWWYHKCRCLGRRHGRWRRKLPR